MTGPGGGGNDGGDGGTGPGRAGDIRLQHIFYLLPIVLALVLAVVIGAQ